MVLKFYASVAKDLKVTVRNGLIPTSVEVTGENLVEGSFLLLLSRLDEFKEEFLRDDK